MLDDCLIVGGGVVGLSLAYELASHKLRVRLIDSAAPGREASWAGAGILPPASTNSREPLDLLTALSNRLHTEWSRRLAAETGIDNGLRSCGGIYLAGGASQARALRDTVAQWRTSGISTQDLSVAELKELEPNLQPTDPVDAAVLVPDERQVRNPRHLKALTEGCARRGVKILPGVAAEDFEVRHGRVEAVRTATDRLPVGAVCITAGAWSRALVERLGPAPAIKPIRGQIALLNCPRPLLNRIVTQTPHYLVPREEGRVLVGSTQEDVGFDRRTTCAAISELLQFAIGTVPTLREGELERCWAGLRPGTLDGLPYMGAIPGLENAFVAAGHYRWGLQLSPGTATVMSQLMRGQQPEIDLQPFRLDRVAVFANPR